MIKLHPLDKWILIYTEGAKEIHHASEYSHRSSLKQIVLTPYSSPISSQDTHLSLYYF